MPKENDGRRSRRRTVGRILLALTGGTLTIVVLVICLGLRSNRATHVVGLPSSVRSRLRSSFEKNAIVAAGRPRGGIKRLPQSSSSSSKTDTIDDVDLAIIRGEYTLINIRTGMTSLQVNADGGDNSHTSGHYTGVQGAFCRIDWSLQATNPAKVPMFRDLQAASSQCQEVTRDLGSMVRKMRQYDLDHPNEVSSAPPSAVVFHETRCGSTLVANLLAASKPNNQHHVYSESPPPLAALQACDNTRHCDPAKHIQLVQDVFFVMGRRPQEHNNNDETYRAFYKIQSIGSHSIGAFTQAFPTTPWFFIFRDSIEVMMSHVDPGPKHQVERWAVCMRTKHWEPKRALAELLKHKKMSVSDLSNEQYCAAHLASLCLSALHEYEIQSPSFGHFINYRQLPNILWESILPNLLNISLDAEDVERMKRVAGVYSKGRQDVEAWEQDSQKKRKEAPLQLQEAAAGFMGEVYQRLEELKE